MKCHILNAEPKNFSPEALKILRTCGDVTSHSFSQAELSRRVKSYDVLWVRLGLCVNQNVLRHASKLKVIVTPTTGLDHIDLEAARRKGIQVLSLKGETHFLKTLSATAEHTWALILALMRRLPWAYQDVLNGGWDRDRFVGCQLKTKKLGILGFGRIGRLVARYAAAFDMKVGFYDPKVKQSGKTVVRFSSLKSFLKWLDILTVHISSSPKSAGFLNKRNLKWLRRRSWVINTSRGEVLDEKVLIELLKKKKIVGAAVDVLCAETRVWKKNHPLVAYARKHSNLIVTPHLGGATMESMAQAEIFMAHRLACWLKTKTGKK